MRAIRITLAVLVLFVAGSALGQNEPTERGVSTTSEKAGPVEFHIVPELGAGIMLQSDQTINFSASDGFFLFRLPGLVFPNWNETTTGLQLEFSHVPGAGGGVRYDILSYTRTKVAGPAYTGANVRIAKGTTDDGVEGNARVMPVVGFKFLTISEHVPLFIEVELLDAGRPVKASVILTWQ